MEIKNKNTARKEFGKIVNRTLPEIFRKENNNLRIGVIKFYNPASNTASVKYLNSGAVITNVLVAKNISSVFVGDIAVVLSNDFSLSKSAYIIAVFGGNRASSGYIPPL